jgi:uncharacterized membrane protein YfcA
MVDISASWPLIIGGGFCVGFLVGLTGVGAGSLMTPFLISGIGVPPVLAVGTDLLFASITKASAAWRHHALGNVDWPIVRWLAAGSLPGALVMLTWIYFGAPDTQLLATLIRKILAGALVVSAVAVASYPLLKRYAMRSADTSVAPEVRRVPTLILGLVLGVLVALTSVGAGAIGVVALTALYQAPHRHRHRARDPADVPRRHEPFQHGQRPPADPRHAAHRLGSRDRARLAHHRASPRLVPTHHAFDRAALGGLLARDDQALKSGSRPRLSSRPSPG